MLIVVIFVAVGAAALRESSPEWDSGVFGVTLLALTACILLFAQRRQRSRAFWLGFATFGWMYLGASLIPPVASRLPTTKGLEWLDSKRQGSGRVLNVSYNIVTSNLFVTTNPAGSAPTTPAITFQSSTPTRLAAPSSPPGLPGSSAPATSVLTLLGPGGGTESFLGIGHSLCAILLAFLGGWFSRSVFDRERTRTARETTAVAPVVASG
jgi:hypothetical protein